MKDIWDYSVATWNVDQAEAYIRQIQGALQLLAGDPRLGRPCDELREGYRKYPSGAHVIFYRVVPGSIDVIRILHQRMDFSRRL